MNIIKESWIYRILQTFVAWIEKQIQNSGLFGWITKETKREEEEGFFEKIWYRIIAALRKVFQFLHLDRIFQGSIFANPVIWIGFTIALTPFLETMQILLFVLASIGSFFLKVMLEEDFRFRYTPIHAWIVVFMLVYALSAIASMSVSTSVSIALLVLSFIAFYFVMVNSITTKKQFQVLWYIWLTVGIVMAFYGIYQYLFAGTFASSSFVDKEMFQDISTRVSGTFESPNVMGTYLLLMIPLTLTQFFEQKAWWKKGIVLGIVGMMLLSLAWTYSRGCYLGVLIALGVFLLLINLKFILVFLAGIIAVPFVLPQSIMNRFASIGNTADSSTSYRISIWKGALDMVKDYWYRPIGQGTVAFRQIYPLYSYSGVGAEHSHNLFLQMIIETGILGLVVFVGFLWKFYQTLGHAIRVAKDKILSIYMMAFLSSMTGFVIQSLFDHTWYNNRLILIFWTFVAFAMITKHFAERKETE